MGSANGNLLKSAVSTICLPYCHSSFCFILRWWAVHASLSNVGFLVEDLIGMTMLMTNFKKHKTLVQKSQLLVTAPEKDMILHMFCLGTTLPNLLFVLRLVTLK